MNIDVSQIVAAKLEQLDADGTIQHKIEETLEKSVMDAITSELGSYSFRNGIAKQVQESVGKLAADCGFSAYNGFIAQTTKAIVQELFSADIAQKVHDALSDVLLQKHENIRLSAIFKRYREWVLENTDESEKYERQEFTCDLDVSESGSFTHYVCRFADHKLDSYYGTKENADVEIRFCLYGSEKDAAITGVYLDGHDMKSTLKIGALSDFEAFVVNLYFNGTKITVDPDDVDDDNSFDIDY